MKNKLLPLVFGATAILITSCQDGERNGRDKAATAVTDSISDTTKRAQMYTADVDLNGDEKAFVLSASGEGLLELEAAKLAHQKTTNEDLKLLTKEIINIYTKSNADLEKVAQGKGMVIPSTLTEESNRRVESLKSLSGTALDKAYITLLISNLTHTEELYSKASVFRNEDMKTFALNMLAKVQELHGKTTDLAIKFNVSNINNGQDLRR